VQSQGCSYGPGEFLCEAEGPGIRERGPEKTCERHRAQMAIPGPPIPLSDPSFSQVGKVPDPSFVLEGGRVQIHDVAVSNSSVSIFVGRNFGCYQRGTSIGFTLRIEVNHPPAVAVVQRSPAATFRATSSRRPRAVLTGIRAPLKRYQRESHNNPLTTPRGNRPQ